LLVPVPVRVLPSPVPVRVLPSPVPVPVRVLPSPVPVLEALALQKDHNLPVRKLQKTRKLRIMPRVSSFVLTSFLF
jgi:hypothetical protein